MKATLTLHLNDKRTNQPLATLTAEIPVTEEEVRLLAGLGKRETSADEEAEKAQAIRNLEHARAIHLQGLGIGGRFMQEDNASRLIDAVLRYLTGEAAGKEGGGA